MFRALGWKKGTPVRLSASVNKVVVERITRAQKPKAVD
jgi:hypothetical protein